MQAKTKVKTMVNVIGELPQFTEEGTEEVKESPVEAPIEEVPAEEVKETPSLPEEKPAEAEPKPQGDDVVVKQGLLTEREKLLQEIAELRKQRRDLRKEETQEVITQVADKLDDLNDVDVLNIERVLKAKGYVTKEESQKLHYESVKNDELTKFLDKYPEYKPENDPNDLNWNSLQKEMSLYKSPSNPKQVAELLLKAHRNIATTVPVTETVAKRIATAQKGAGGTQRTSAGKSLPPNLRRAYEDGGWSEAEIKELEDKL